VLSNQPACWRSTKASSEALLAIGRLDLNAERTKDIDAKVGSRLAVLFVTRHGGSNLGVNQPMAALDIVVVTARTNALNDEGLDGLDGGKAVDGGHDDCIQLTIGRSETGRG
jgi:hypothetical protein